MANSFTDPYRTSLLYPEDLKDLQNFSFLIPFRNLVMTDPPPPCREHTRVVGCL